MEFELAYYDTAVHRFNQYTTRTAPHLRIVSRNKSLFIYAYVSAFWIFFLKLPPEFCVVGWVAISLSYLLPYLCVRIVFSSVLQVLPFKTFPSKTRFTAKKTLQNVIGLIYLDIQKYSFFFSRGVLALVFEVNHIFLAKEILSLLFKTFIFFSLSYFFRTHRNISCTRCVQKESWIGYKTVVTFQFCKYFFFFFFF